MASIFQRIGLFREERFSSSAEHSILHVVWLRGLHKLVHLGSLRQLTLAGFLLSLVPLAFLLWQSQQNLNSVSRIAVSEAQFSVGVVRKVVTLDGLAKNVERTLRQSSVVTNDALQELAKNYLVRFGQTLEEVCPVLDNKSACDQLRQRGEWFKENLVVSDPMLLDAQLAEFGRALEQVKKHSDVTLDSRIRQQQIRVEHISQSQTLTTVSLISVSLLLILLVSRLINRPVEKLKRLIGMMAEQEATLPAISDSGPRELIEVEHKLHWLAERLQQLEHLRHALLRHASHELKTPLASIKEGCSLLSENVVGELNGQQREVMSLLNSSTERLNVLIEQLLDYNLLLQQAKPVWEWCKTEDMLNDFLQENGLAISQHNTQVEVTRDVEQVHVDIKLFRRILDNLLSNAIAHGSRGRPITVHLYKRVNQLVLDVGNRGRKIPEELREGLFEPFKRGEGPRNDRVMGSGLGLSIVADCARLMRGSASFVDIDNADVCVRVTLPHPEESDPK